MSNTIKKAFLIHGLAILGFVLITVLVYYPYFLEGEQISQHDILQGKGGNYQLRQYSEKTGEEALWLNSMFSGMPGYLAGVKYTGDLLLSNVYNIVRLGMPHPEGITFVSFVCFYILLLVFKVRPWIAFAGAVVFGLNGFNVISIVAGHNAKIAAVAFAPLVLAGVHLAFKGKRWLGVGVTALALALHIRTNHYQITYYLLLILIVYGAFQLFYAFKEGKLKNFSITLGCLVLVAVLAAGSNIAKLWTVYEYSQYSTRGTSALATDDQDSGLDPDYVFTYSNSILEPIFLFIPNIFGGSSTQELSMNSATADALKRAGYNRNQLNQQLQSIPTYWGDQPLTAPYYVGSLIFFLFVLGIVVLDKKQKAWILVVAGMGIVLSWGNNFSALNEFLFNYLPAYNKFRSVTFTIIMTVIAINLLSFMALEKVIQQSWSKDHFKKMLMAVAISGGFALLLIIISEMLSYKGAVDDRLPEWLIGAIREDRASLLRKDAFRALFYILLMASLIWAYWKNKLKASYAFGIIILLSFLDVFLLSRRFLDRDDFTSNPINTYFKPTEADRFILSEAESGERVLNLQNPFNEARTSYFHESIGGYHGAKMGRYQDLIDQVLGQEINSIITSLKANERNFSNIPGLNMLNTRFFVAGNQRNAVLRNSNALGNAWFVNDIIKVNSADEALTMVNEIDPGEEAIINTSDFATPEVDGSATGQVTLLKRSPNEIIYTAQATGDGLAVFSEIYYPKGWNAYVDGEKTRILRANYVLRALSLSEGSHEVKFVFEPTSYYLGNTISMIGSVLILLVFVGSVGYELYRFKSHETQGIDIT